MKFAEGLHDGLGDPAFFPSVTNLTKEMISKETAIELKNKIDDTRIFDPEYYGTLSTSSDHGTSHVSVIGPDEEMVSMTT